MGLGNMVIDGVKKEIFKLDLNKNGKADIEELGDELKSLGAELAPFAAKLTQADAVKALNLANTAIGDKFSAAEISKFVSIAARIIAGIKKISSLLQAVK